jgi:hypothetical protein
MMLRINLLPAYLAERRKTRTAIILSTLLFLGVLGGMLFWWSVTNTAVLAKEDEATRMEQEATAVQGLETEASTIRQGVQPISAKVDFIKQVRFYNGLKQRIYRQAARYTTSNIEYSSMAVQGETLSMNAFANKVPDIGRFLITFFGNPDVRAVSVNGVPGWPRGQNGGGGGYSRRRWRSLRRWWWWPVRRAAAERAARSRGWRRLRRRSGGGGQAANRPGFPFTVTALLIRPVVAPVPPAAGGGAAGAPGAGSPFGGGGGPYGGGGVARTGVAAVRTAAARAARPLRICSSTGAASTKETDLCETGQRLRGRRYLLLPGC